jgi:hypothetical protein
MHGFTRCSRCPFAGFYPFCSQHIPLEIEIETLLHSVLSCHSPAISISKILSNHSLASSLMELDGKPHTTLPHAHPTSSSSVLPCCPGPSNMVRSPCTTFMLGLAVLPRAARHVIACLASSILALGMAVLPQVERCGCRPLHFLAPCPNCTAQICMLCMLHPCTQYGRFALG